eukprot:gene10305-2722_t
MGGPGTIDGKKHSETDNFQRCKFKINGVEYSSAENYFQCSKTTTKEEFEFVRNSGCGSDVWMAGSKVKLRNDWESVKVNIMYEGNKAKFEQNPDFIKQLCNSEGKVKFYASSNFWCKWNGLIFERLRAEFRKNGEEDENVAKKIKKMMDDYQEENK